MAGSADQQNIFLLDLRLPSLQRQSEKQGEITDIYTENGVWHCISKLGADFTCKSVVIATGTFLGGRVYVGEVNYPS